MSIVESRADYDSPSWSHKQADTNGYNRALKEIMSLCETSDQDNQ